MGLNNHNLNGSSILITGGGGYIGSRLMYSLANLRVKIFAIDIMFNPQLHEFAKKQKNIELIECNLRDSESLNKICLRIKPDYIYHFAAMLTRDRDFRIFPEIYAINVQATLNLLNAIREINYKNFFFSSTGEVYGAKNLPPFTEDMLPAPVSPYSLTKLMSENLIRTYSEIYEKPFLILRIFNFFGSNIPRATIFGQLLDSLHQKLVFTMTKGEQKRDYLHIDELLEQILFLSNKNITNEIFNICSGIPTTIAEFVELFKIACGEDFVYQKTLQYRANEIWSLYGDNSKLLASGYKYSSSTLLEKIKISL